VARMRKLWAVLGSALFFLIAPGSVSGLLPVWIARGHDPSPVLESPGFHIAGIVLAIMGAAPLVESFARFALVGLGTPAPVAPPKHLVVTGFYRYMRNPMYIGVLTIISGDALILADPWLFAYAVAVWLLFQSFVLVYEEPTLRRRYGNEYDTFCAHVPRWIPRLTPWTPAS
jgi:protein-S-isoprenylcysteine O-methyltransferase Ste14